MGFHLEKRLKLALVEVGLKDLWYMYWRCFDVFNLLEILEALHSVNIVPQQHDIPIVSEVTNQVRQYLEKLIIIALNKNADVSLCYLIT